MKIKIAIVLNIIILLLMTGYIVWNGWHVAIKETERFWLREKFGISALDYKAKRLWELPVERQIEKVFGKDAAIAKAIAKAESGMKCEAISHTGDVSVFQVNKIHSWRGNILDCTNNILIAKQIYDEQGWIPWISYQNKSYQRYLK